MPARALVCVCVCVCVSVCVLRAGAGIYGGWMCVVCVRVAFVYMLRVCVCIVSCVRGAYVLRELRAWCVCFA